MSGQFIAYGRHQDCALIIHSRLWVDRQVSIDSFEDVPQNSEADLAKAVSQQPISVAICASQLQFYSSGMPSNLQT